ncbi:MAG: hypothetical protein PUJ57_03880 [Peptoniphilaceae bacterium]|nr:hypothetical protein [Peptoniphilaceae bacterium]MDY6085193.1 hypothetical protein [Peptoniphilaceae bacterium]
MRKMEHRASSSALHVVTLETEELIVTIYPEIGFKIASIVYKPKEFEALARPLGIETVSDERMLYQRAYPGAPFSHYDLSGIDDCIPTIDACNVSDLGHFADHGDAWSRAWNVFEEDRTMRSVKAYFRLSAIPLYFERHIHIEGHSIFLKYRVLNESVQARPFLWALHDLCRYEPDAVLSWPEPATLMNAHGDEAFDFDLHRMDDVPVDGAYKFYLTEPLSQGAASITYPTEGVRLSLYWDPKVIPYLGGWVNTGGSAGPKTIALEPTNGYYDSLARAIANQKVGQVGPGKEQTWTVELRLESVESWTNELK